jgi:hypothetical protein
VVPDVDARDVDDGRRGPELVRGHTNVLLEEADQRADDVNVLACGRIVVSDGQKSSAECIDVMPDARDGHSD